MIDQLRRRGYGINSSRQFALQLNKPSKTVRRNDGRMQREVLGRGLLAEQLEQVLRECESVVDAANQIEAFVNGGDMLLPQRSSSPGGASMDAETMAKLIENRVDAAVAPLRNEFGETTVQLRNALGEVKGLLESLRPKSKGRPKGSKNKPKDTDAGSAQD